MSFGLFLFFIFVLIANVVIGYVIAVLLGIGPPDFRTAWTIVKSTVRRPSFLHAVGHMRLTRWKSVLNSLTTFFVSLIGRLKMIRPRSSNETPSLTESSEVQSTDDAEDLFHAKLQAISARDVRDFLDDESSTITQITPIQEFDDDHLPNVISIQGTEIWMATNKHIEESVQKLNIIRMGNGRFSGELDEELRSMPSNVPLEEVRRVCQNLAEDCRNYLENQSKITAEIHDRADEFEELAEMAEVIDLFNRKQTTQIQSALDHLDQLTELENVEDTIQNLLQNLTKLRQARHQTRDIQYLAFVSLARAENRLGTINRNEALIDYPTGLDNRIAFQTQLWEWWQQKRHMKSKLTFVLYDVVGFTEWNSRVGIRTCDKILTALAHEIGNRIEGKIFLGMYSGNCLVSVSSDIGFSQTTTLVEKIRREIEHTTFTWGSPAKDASVQLTCAVTEATGQQSEADVIRILDQTLAAAKNDGRNLTYMYDSAKPAPERAEFPEQTVADKIVDLTAMPGLETIQQE